MPGTGELFTLCLSSVSIMVEALRENKAVFMVERLRKLTPERQELLKAVRLSCAYRRRPRDLAAVSRGRISQATQSYSE
jgi:hypothetical protein